ncbi:MULTISPECIES: alcohol dehydrogenase catalytic domain-containing protein [Pseudonocardia]|uniref:alcohol dehydrogenase n=2 Tax=Pseudonocardia TaxID=1847 RepID=A0A1Y2MP99_PSEAH|nr:MULTISPECIES: alcohol dehydrogenase catalytic domain-containing protein [Pseudonocardia]OSY37064.1 Alcohol dehydrogenase [Pseudonocardia autotrophica]TDN72037.1 propanol-preferring alcohol dehydrogenase [Pseudonocardia autotrophica]BBG02732.1 oxidoreductase [Pseudonocardia autotrophica]GEC25935.1 oxidoreductase [Pseudonocardia saturnea]
MHAYRMTAAGTARMVELPAPRPGPGQVLLQVRAAGICHSDLHVLDAPAAMWEPPFTLGHEICGTVTATGDGADPELVGRQVVVHAPYGCGECSRCRAGATNDCDRRRSLPAGLGLGVDGGMADEIVVDAARLVGADGLDPAEAAALTDAGLTSYRAVTGSAAHLAEPGAVAVVIGVGGLGHMAIGILRARTGAHVVAVDTREEALELARACGAQTACRPDEAAAAVASASEGRGADVVLDFVAAQATLDGAGPLLRIAGELVLVGGAGGVLAVRKPGPLPSGASLRLPFWGSYDELVETVALARQGGIRARTTTYPLSEVTRALEDLRAGRVLGRAVLVPE